MEFLSEDPTYLAGGLGILAGIFLVALKLTQQGKFLVWAAAALALAAAVVGVERAWVTDNERIEGTIYRLGRAVARSDYPGVLDCLTPDVQYVVSGNSTPSEATRQLIRHALGRVTFEHLAIVNLKASAGGQSRRGQAEFRVLSSGSYNGVAFPPYDSAWSLGLRETGPGVWQVHRISPVSLPGHQHILPIGLIHPEWFLKPDPVAPPPPQHRPRRLNRRSALAKLNIPDPSPPPMQP